MTTRMPVENETEMMAAITDTTAVRFKTLLDGKRKMVPQSASCL